MSSILKKDNLISHATFGFDNSLKEVFVTTIKWVVDYECTIVPNVGTQSRRIKYLKHHQSDDQVPVEVIVIGVSN